MIIKGTYVGPRQELLGHTALLREADMSMFRSDISCRYWDAQFDDLVVHGEDGDQLAFGWHPFDYDEFEVEYLT
jgi:hypothetical protein